MKLTGKQGKRIHDAIQSSYKSESLAMALRFQMDVELDDIVAKGPFAEQVFALIDWADKLGRVMEVVEALQTGNTDNDNLNALVNEVRGWGLQEGAAPSRETELAYLNKILSDYDRLFACMERKRGRANDRQAGCAYGAPSLPLPSLPLAPRGQQCFHQHPPPRRP